MCAESRLPRRRLVALRWLTLLAVLPAALAWANPDIQHWKTSNGAQVLFVRSPDLPMVDLRVVFHAGSARDGDQSGVASLTSRMLSTGAGGLDADQIASRFGDLGADFGAGSERDMAWVSLRSLSEAKLLDPAVDTLATVLTQPSFPVADFAREQKRTLAALEQEQQSPGAVATRAFYKALYGNHPYASMPMGTADSVKALTRDDLVAFHKRYYVARNAVVAIVGDLDQAAAKALAERAVGKLPAGEAASALPPVPALAASKVVRIKRPTTQTHILMGQPGDYRGDPDYFVLYVGNHALGGGGLVSRLADEVREKRGLSYSVYSYFVPMARKGPFMMGAQTRNDQTAETIKVMRATLDKYLKQGITAKELKASKENITGGFPLHIASNKDIVGYLAMIGFYHLPLDYLDKFNGKIEAVTRKQIDTVMRARVHPDRMITVIVGGGA